MPRQPKRTVVFHAAIGLTLKRFVGPVAQALRASGFRCVAASAEVESVVTVGDEFDAVYETPPYRRGSPAKFVRASAELVRILRIERPSLLHLHTPYGIALGRIASAATGTPHMAVVHGTLFGQRTPAGRAFSAVETVAARYTKTYVTLNSEDQISYRRLAPRSRVHQAPCGGAGIDVRRLQMEAEAISYTASRPPRLLVMCRLTADKNLDLAVEAWRRARVHTPDLQLRIVGSAVPGEPSWAPPNEPGLVSLPWTESPGAELANADVLLSTSPREGFSMVLAEALVLGTPVVAVENRGSRAVFGCVRAGMIVVGASADDISTAILRQIASEKVEIASSVVADWSQQRVVDYHVGLILEQTSSI